jgi:hypothetical protein
MGTDLNEEGNKEETMKPARRISLHLLSRVGLMLWLAMTATLTTMQSNSSPLSNTPDSARPCHLRHSRTTTIP